MSKISSAGSFAKNQQRSCAAEGCDKPAPLQCPTCVKLGLPSTHYCGQECFQASWKVHNRLHKAKKAFKPPPFAYTGTLRPAFKTPQRKVTDPNIKLPDYALTGIPVGENEHRRAPFIKVYTKKERKGIRAACRLGREILDYAHSLVRPGITTEEIDRAVHEAIVSRGAYPSPLNYHNFPKSVCTSVNEVVCHGIPDCRPLQDGDIVNIDVTVYYKGYHGDLNETYTVGEVDDESKRLIKVTHDCLMEAIKLVKPGAYFRDFGTVISRYVNKQGFQVVRTYCGHGIGDLFHTTPSIPHYAKNKAAGILKPGMIFTIEPMINAGTWREKMWTFDDWTSVTIDGKRSAQFEHQVLVTENGVEVLTARTADSPPLWWEAKKDESVDAKSDQ